MEKKKIKIIKKKINLKKKEKLKEEKRNKIVNNFYTFND